MDIRALKNLGLTDVQSKVYVSLINLGSVTTGPIIQETGLQNSVVYHALNHLEEQGLISAVIIGKRKQYSAADPKTLVTMMKDRTQQVEQLSASLAAIKKAPNPANAELFIGWRGVYTAFNTILEELPKKGEYIGFAAGLEEEHTPQSNQFFREFQKKRAAMNYNIKLIANESSRKQIKTYKYYQKFGKPHYRFVNGFAPKGIIIFNNNILITTFEDPTAVLTRSESLAKSYRQFFDAMWQIARE